MEITEVKIRKIYDKPPLCAMVSLVFDNEIAVHEIKIIKGEERRFVAMPSRLEHDGVYRDIIHPLNGMVRERLERAVFEAYDSATEKNKDS